MDNDSIRCVGANTLVDIWIDGKLRSICVSRPAIQESLGLVPDQAAALSDEDRCEFVRKHMSMIMAAARTRLRDDPEAGTVVIDSGHLPRQGGGRVAERRKGERRKADRGRADGERRRTQRRVGDRRRSPPVKPTES